MAEELALLPHQEEFIHSTHRHTGLVGGFGSGKSRAGTLKTIDKKLQYPGVNVAYYLPTYSLIRDIAYPNFEEILTKARVEYQLLRGDREILTRYGKIIFRSMDNPNTIVGYEVGYSLIDEADILGLEKMREAVVKILARNRTPLPNGDIQQLDMVSTPEGFNYLYEFFVKNAKDTRRIIRAKTADNPYLPQEYLDSLAELYTAEQLAAYMGGEFVNLNSGTVYYKYNRALNSSKLTPNASHILHLGQDFNVGKMNGVLHVIDENYHPHAVGEIVDAYDTADLIAAIKERYPRHQIIAYPDAAGKARSTSGKSDHQLLREARFTLAGPSSNPRIADRINIMNGMFCNAQNKRRYHVNVDLCPNYAAALEQLPYKNGLPDKASGLDHITEAAGYFIHTKYGKRSFTATAS